MARNRAYSSTVTVETNLRFNFSKTMIVKIKFYHNNKQFHSVQKNKHLGELASISKTDVFVNYCYVPFLSNLVNAVFLAWERPAVYINHKQGSVLCCMQFTDYRLGLKE